MNEKRIYEMAKRFEDLDLAQNLPTPMLGKILACIFYTKAIRLRFAWEAAMLKLGGSVTSTEDASKFSSMVKGETLADTLRIVSGYADIIVLYVPDKDAAKGASSIASVPVINASIILPELNESIYMRMAQLCEALG